MASREGYESPVEQVVEGPTTRGRAAQRSPSRQNKATTSTTRDVVEERFATLEGKLEEVQEKLGETSELMEELLVDHAEVSKITKAMIEDLRDSHGKDIHDLIVEVTNMRKFMEEELHALRKDVDEVRAECLSRHNANGTASTSTSHVMASTHHIKVPKPEMYNGTRNATIVENFLFGLEQYYEALGIVDDGAKIANAPNFLREAAQLWWRRKHAEREKDRSILRTWEQFKGELRKHFVPHNAEMEARGKLRRLRQTGSIPEYVKEFTTLMLEIDDMSDKDALFHFRDGLKDWARLELDRRNVQNLDDAIATVETLTDYRPKEKRNNESGGEVSETRKEHVHKARDSHRDSGRHGKATEAKKGTSFKTPSPCFLCNGPHWARDCPQKKVLSALMAKLHKREEEEVPIPEEAHLGGIQYLGAMKVVPSSKEPIGKGLLYVDATLNNQAALALLDTGATSNIIDLEEAKRLGLKITRRDDVELKIINAEPTRNYGWAWNVKVKIGEWKGKIDFLLAPLDDCKVVLGLDFMKQAHAYVDATRETLVFPNKEREVPLKCIGMTGKVMIGAMQTRRHRKGKGSNGSVATRALRRLSGGGCHVPRNDPTFCTKKCYKTPKRMPKGSQAHSSNNPIRPCDSPHVPTTHAHDIGMCPQKAAHEPRMHVVTRAHDSPMCVYGRTPHGRGHQTRRQAPTPPRRPMCTDSCTWHGGQPTRRAHRRPRPSDGRPCQTWHGARGPMRARPSMRTTIRARPCIRAPHAPKRREASRRIGKARDTSRGARPAPAKKDTRARAQKALEGPRARQTTPDASRRPQTRPCAYCSAHARSRQPQKLLERPRQYQNVPEWSGHAREGPGTCWNVLDKARTC